MKEYNFFAHECDYKLTVGRDCFGGEGVIIYENGIFLGIIDMADERDFEAISKSIASDPYYVEEVAFA